MGNPLFTNNAGTTFANPVDKTDTIVTVVGGGGSLFPNPTGGDYFMVTFISTNGTELEICKCTARAGDTLTVIRAQEGTGAQNFQIADQCQLRITAQTMNTVVAAVGSDHVKDIVAGAGISATGTGSVTVTNTGVLSFNGAAGNITFQGVPTGTLSMWPTVSAPTGYLLCDGSSVSTTTYAALFAVVGYTFGGSGASFTLPNYVNRMPIGVGSIAALAATGGSADAIVVSHTHNVIDPSHSHTYAARPSQGGLGPVGGGSNLSQDATGTTATATTGITIGTTGSSATNANLPPYLGINFIIKV